jgi:hypothetical protein
VRLVSRVEQDVRWLHVAMQDASLVREVHRPGDRGDGARGLCGRKAPSRRERAGEARALHQPHAVEVAALVLADLEDGDDVRMVQPGSGPGLGVEAQDLRRRGEPSAEDHLERHLAPEPILPGSPDDSHPAARDLLDQLVSAETARRRPLRCPFLEVHGARRG